MACYSGFTAGSGLANGLPGKANARQAQASMLACARASPAFAAMTANTTDPASIVIRERSRASARSRRAAAVFPPSLPGSSARRPC